MRKDIESHSGQADEGLFQQAGLVTRGVIDSPFSLNIKAFCADNLQAAFLKFPCRYPWCDDANSDTNLSHLPDCVHVTEDPFLACVTGLVLKPLVNLAGALVGPAGDDELVLVKEVIEGLVDIGEWVEG